MARRLLAVGQLVFAAWGWARNVDQIRIAVLLYENCALMDFSGPVSIFHGAGRHYVWTAQSAEPAYEVSLLSLDGGRIRTWEGAVVETRPAGEAIQQGIDTLMVVGGLGDDRDVDPRLIAWLRSNGPTVRRLASVCSGAYLLAAAGFLDRRRAATHWEDCEPLGQRFPLVHVRRDALYVNEGAIWTSGGVTAGIDMALAMVEQDCGAAVASLVARRHLVPFGRDSGQAEFSSDRHSPQVQGPMASLLNWIVQHPREDLRAEALAARANMSLRNFYRAFRRATGKTPAEWVEMMRVEFVKKLLLRFDLSIDEVAYRAGFSGYEHLRKVFSRSVGSTPGAYRQKVAETAAGGGAKATVSDLADLRELLLTA